MANRIRIDVAQAKAAIEQQTEALPRAEKTNKLAEALVNAQTSERRYSSIPLELNQEIEPTNTGRAPYRKSRDRKRTAGKEHRITSQTKTSSLNKTKKKWKRAPTRKRALDKG